MRGFILQHPTKRMQSGTNVSVVESVVIALGNVVPRCRCVVSDLLASLMLLRNQKQKQALFPSYHER